MNPHQRLSPARVSRECYRDHGHRLARAGPAMRIAPAPGADALPDLRPGDRQPRYDRLWLGLAGVHRRVLDVVPDGRRVVGGGATGALLRFDRNLPMWKRVGAGFVPGCLILLLVGCSTQREKADKEP